MTSGSIEYTPDGPLGYAVTLTTAAGRQLRLEGSAEDQRLTLRGARPLKSNESVVTNVAAYARHERLRRRARSDTKRQSHETAAAKHADVAVRVADYVEKLGDRTRFGWCSCCFQETTHTRVEDRSFVPSVFLCERCGAPTTPCFAPRCLHMANRGTASARLPRYCAEHRHDIPGFDKLDDQLASLDDVDDWLAYERVNLAAATKVALAAGLGAAVLAPAAILAAPAIGAALGGSMLGGGLSGAAATSHGLAMLGGGAIASGGLGMAGGTVVVVTAGASLGSALGATTTSAYVRDDASFRIEKLRDGDGPPVLVASGFLTQKDKGWGAWERLIDDRFPDSPVYRVFWGSKELRNLFAVVGGAGGKAAAVQFAKVAAARGGRKAAAVLPWVAAPLVAGDVVANPWTVARKRADMTGAALADILARAQDGPYVLVGHSLGARVMATAGQVLATRRGPTRLEDVHLLGAAIASDGDWRSLGESVNGTVWNYFSHNDRILGQLYRNAQLREHAAGAVGIAGKHPGIRNIDLSRTVKGHSEYFDKARLR